MTATGGATMKTRTSIEQCAGFKKGNAMNCKIFNHHLQDLLLDPQAPSNASARQHMAVCDPCQGEYNALVSTMSMMDSWAAPEPSPYFDQKLAVLLREEAAQPKLGFFARLHEHLLFNTGRQFRSATAGALALVLMLGGGFVGLQTSNRSVQAPGISATVHDLQTLDKDEQTLQQMDQLLHDDDAGDDAANAPS